MSKNLRKLSLPLLIAGCLGASFPAAALDAGDLLVRGRIININPDADSTDVKAGALGGAAVPGTTVDVEDAWTLDVDFTYMLTKNWGAELLLDISSKHDVTAKGETLVGLAPGTIIETRVLPPALILQYHFAPDAQIRPYVGLGANFTYFFSEDATASLNNGLNGGDDISDVDLDSSFGLVGQVGMDYDLGNDMFLNLDVKYMQIDTTATFTTAALGSVEADVDINPWVFGLGIGKRF